VTERLGAFAHIVRTLSSVQQHISHNQYREHTISSCHRPRYDSASEMTCIVSSGALNSTHSLTHSRPRYEDDAEFPQRRLNITSYFSTGVEMQHLLRFLP